MKLLVDQKPISPENVTYNDGLGYGRYNRGDIELHSYSLFIERNDLIETLSAKYYEVVEEIRKDDEHCRDSSPFKDMGYVSLDRAFDHPAQLAEAVETYFDREIFDIYVSVSKSFKYVINSTDKVSVSDEGLLIEGRCFRQRRPSNSSSQRTLHNEAI